MPARPFQEHNSARPENMVYRFVRLRVGDSHDLNVSGTGTTPTIAEYVPPKDFMLVRINLHAGNSGIAPDNFIGLAALTNGVRFVIADKDDNELLDFNDGETVQIHDHFSLLAGTDVIHQPQGVGLSGSLLLRWTIERAGKKIWLRPGERFCFLIQDDLTSLDELHIVVQGYFANP